MQGLTLTLEDDEFKCLSPGQDIILTCDIFGFPRPEIVFSKNGMNILPGRESFMRITNIIPDQVCCYIPPPLSSSLYSGGNNF